LDIAIAQGHREVIRVLLDDPNWFKLIRLNNRVTAVYEDDEVGDDTSADESLSLPDMGDEIDRRKSYGMSFTLLSVILYKVSIFLFEFVKKYLFFCSSECL
jgi:hypothetical protein